VVTGFFGHAPPPVRLLIMACVEAVRLPATEALQAL
jgi:hypothetical protein